MPIKLTTLFFLCFASATQAQMLVTGKVIDKDASAVLHFNVPYENWYYNGNTIVVKPDSKGEFKVVLNIKQPQLFFLRIGKQQVNLYGEPNKTIDMQFEVLQLDSMIFGGELRRENKLWQSIGLTSNTLFPERWNNTTTSPAEIFSLIEQNQQDAIDKLDRLTQKLSAEFARITRGDIQYFAISKLWDIFYDLHQGTRRPDSGEWSAALMRAYNASSLSNDNVQQSYHYQNAVTYYPRFVQMKEGKSIAENILHMSFDSLKVKGKDYLEYNVLAYGLEGRSLERAKASFIIHSIYQGKLSYVEKAYDDFRKRYPASPYMNKVNEVMRPYLEMKENGTLYAFITDARYKTLDDIIAAHRGRVIFIDIWGTWCGPCREEFTYHAGLKDKFENEPVDFVFVAIEKSIDRTKIWKETALFYRLAGEHILAGKELEASFRDLYEKKGSESLIFPSYLLIDRNGKLVTSQASRPSSGKTLYDEITAVLRRR